VSPLLEPELLLADSSPQGETMFEYAGSTALVTGASKGLGVAFAEALAERGMNLLLVARSTDKLNVLSRRLHAKSKVQSTILSIDLADPNGPQTIAEELERRGIQVDLLVNNAGFGLSGEFLSHDPEQERAEIEVNVQALVALTHYFGKAMAARGKGGIINVASNAGFQPLPYMATYAATKAFVLHFSEAIRHELTAKGVHVMATCPGPTATSFFEGTSTQMSPENMDSSESVVRRTLEAFDQGRGVAYPGRTTVQIASWLPRLLPRALVVRIAGMASVKMGLDD
jgi:short-subunit dehydrogenase